MRALVKRSRVHAINKYAKERKKLMEKKGTEEQKKQNFEKADRMLHQMLIMKKAHLDDVSKFALLNEKSLFEITSNVNESLENKALARLATHKIIGDAVKEFRKEYADWKVKLPDFYAIWDLKPSKNKKKKHIVGKKTVQKVMAKARKFCNTSPAAEHASSPHLAVKKFGQEEIEGGKDASLEKQEIYENDPEFENDSRLAPESKNDKLKRRKNERVSEKPPLQTSVDPFFLTKDDEEYISTQVVSTLPEDLNYHSYRRGKRNFDEIPKEKAGKFRDFAKKKPPQPQEPPPLPLHPSWQAKRKQLLVAPPQGKKIVFE